MALTAKLHARAQATYSANVGLGTAEMVIRGETQAISWTSGTGAGQADLLFADQRTIADSENDDLDLAGSLTDVFGNTLTFVEICAMEVRAAGGNTNDVVVGGAASNAFTGPFGDASDTIAVQPGGVLALGAPDAGGWTVAAGTGDVLRIANGGAGSSVTYDIVLVGRSA